MEESVFAALTASGMDVSATIQRFGGNESLFLKYLKRFPTEPTFGLLEDAVWRNDSVAVKTHCHTLKGISGNLGLTPLFNMCASMMTTLRTAGFEDALLLFGDVKREYQNAVQMIQCL